MGNENYFGMKDENVVSLLLTQILTVVGLLTAALTAGITGSVLNSVIIILTYVIVLLYTFFGYKKPHGNLLKYTVMIYAFHLGLLAVSFAAGQNVRLYGAMLYVAASVLSAYVSGKLNRIDRNKKLFCVIGALLTLANVLMPILSFALPEVNRMNSVTQALPVLLCELMLWGTLFLSYVTRFHQHRQAGLDDG